jgi:hypothetical protein
MAIATQAQVLFLFFFLQLHYQATFNVESSSAVVIRTQAWA